MYELKEIRGLYVDACIARSDKTLAFLSVFGRDTAMHQLRAAITLADQARGLSSLECVKEGRPSFKVLLDNHSFLSDELRTRTKIAPYGAMGHCFIVDARCREIDKANGRATLLLQNANQLDEAVWQIISELSPVALLPHWQVAVMQHIEGLCTPLIGIGSVKGVDIALPEGFEYRIGSLVRQKVLRV